LYYTYSRTTPTRAINSAVVSSSRVHLSSLASMPLLVKAMALKGTLVVVSRVITLVVQILESVRTGCTSSHRLPRGIRLRICLAAPSQQSVVLYSVRTTTFLIFSALSMTDMCRMSPVLAIVTLGHSKMHSSPSDHGSMTPKIK